MQENFIKTEPKPKNMSKYQKLTNNDTMATLTDDDEQHLAPFKNCDDNLNASSYKCDDHAKNLNQYNDIINASVYCDAKHKSNINTSPTNAVDCTTNGNISINSQWRGNGSDDTFLITSLDGDESTMEIPLLQPSYGKNNNTYIHSYNSKDGAAFVCLCQQKGFACNLNSKSTQTAKSKILWAIGMCCIFMIVEFLGGYIAGSLAIMTDAAHLASDCISFVIGLVAICLGNKPPDGKMSFGYKRLEVMGAIISILSIWILTATLVLVAIERIFSHDYDLDANTMMTISAIGILINIIMIFILHTSSDGLPEGGIGAAHGHNHSHNRSHSHSRNHNHHGHSHSHHSYLSPSSQHHRPSNDNSHPHSELSAVVTTATQQTDTSAGNSNGSAVDTSEAATTIDVSPAPLQLNGIGLKHEQDGNATNLNLRAATIHVIGDLVQSVGVFIASILIKIYPGAKFLDPLCTMLFSVIVIMTTTKLFRESMYIIMDSVPQGLSMADLEMDLLEIEGVKAVHHLNVWNHTSDHTILMVHLIIDLLVDSNTVLMKATQLASGSKYKVKHSTIQIERVNS